MIDVLNYLYSASD
uniref:Uncharacterized protein n=1 Tax=Lepeophtheirus salmonis TaxID=72036 RepID=A0A0K2UJJ9_LEPSM